MPEPYEGSDRFVSQASFHDVLTLLSENRNVMREQVAQLSGQLADATRTITGKQDIANGRLGKAEVAIVALEGNLSSVEEKVGEILEKGCRVKDLHAQQLAAIIVRRTAAGAIEPVSDLPDEPGLLPFLGWTRQQTIKRVGIGSGLVGAGVLLPHLFTGLHWVLEHFAVVAPTIK